MIIPYLREDLEILRGNSREDGSPAWLLYDALRNKYFTLGLTAFKLIKNWSGGDDIKNFEKKINQEGIETNSDEIKQFIDFLQLNNLIIQPRGQNDNLLLRQKNSQKRNWLFFLIHSYLFFKIPLVKPDEWLNKTLRYIKPLGEKKFRNIIYILGFVGICLVIQQFESFLNTFLYFFSFEGLLFYLVALVFVKSLHELGHAYVSKHYGCRVSSIGIAFLVFFPFLYTDASDAWRLRDHKDRLLINFAGILTELHLALFATFLWAVLPDGSLKSVSFFIATTSWISSLAINVSPFMRFDGYYVFSDWLKAENLQPRSFKLARWQLREILFGFKHKPPEYLNPTRRWTFILYAWLTWVYRFFIFLGIAFLVYNFAFKVLGIILFVIEIYWFILRPIINEIQNWFKLKNQIKLNKQTIRLYSILLFLFIILFLPWKSSIKIPAVYVSEKYSKIYPPYPTKIKQIFVEKNQSVKKGQKLIELSSPEMDLKINQVRRKIKLVKTKINSLSKSANNLDQYMILQQKLIFLKNELDGLNKIKSKFLLKSPFNGKIKNFSNLSINQWVSNLNSLFGVMQYGTGNVVGYLKENEIDRFKTNEEAVFIPFNGEHSKVKLISKNLDQSAISSLPYLSLSSQHDGPIATRKFISKEYNNRPIKAHYQVSFDVVDKTDLNEFEIPGYVHINGYRYSPVFNFFKSLLSTLVRESRI
tara:strand:+ start:535 stop:2640 length:2106 start_codon:yes stop_codon:yes gene_type:complete